MHILPVVEPVSEPALAAVQRWGGPGELLELEAIYGDYADQVLRWAVRLGVARADAQDTVQEVFLIVQRRLPTLRRDQNLRSWLFGITRRVVDHERRRERSRSRFAASEALEAVAEDRARPDHHVERHQNLARVQAVLETMRESERTAILLFEIEQVSGQQLAELMGLKLSQVWGLVHRARRHFARRLAELEAREAEETGGC